MAEAKKLNVKQRIIKITNEIRIERKGKNDFHKFEYFRPDDVLQALNPLLDKYNLIMLFNMEFLAESQMYKGTLRLEDLKDQNDAIDYRFDIPLTDVSGSSKAQGAGATQTYCKRYMIMNTFNIAENNSDLDSMKHKPVKQSKSDEKKDMIANSLKTISNLNDKDKLTKLRQNLNGSNLYTQKEKQDFNKAITVRLNEIS